MVLSRRFLFFVFFYETLFYLLYDLFRIRTDCSFSLTFSEIFVRNFMVCYIIFGDIRLQLRQRKYCQITLN